MSASDIKTQHDRTIRRMIADGAIRREIVVATGLTGNALDSRCRTLGLSARMAANGQARRVERRRAGLTSPAYNTQRTGFCGSTITRSVIESRVDRAASDLANRLRAARADVGALGYDPSHLIASFHAAGLTLDDIEECVGIPPAVAASAIRRAHQLGLS